MLFTFHPCSPSDSATSLMDKQAKFDQKSEDIEDTVDAHIACSCENEDCSAWSCKLQHTKKQKHFNVFIMWCKKTQGIIEMLN